MCVSSPGDTTGCQGTREGCCRPLVCSRMCKLSVKNQRKGNIQVASDRETCAAAFCCSLRSTIQLSCIPTQSALTADDSRPVAETAPQTHTILPGESALFVTNTLTHVCHAHIWSLHFMQPPPRGTPRPSIQQHPVLTFEDVRTEAVKDEDEVLLDNHILLFSVTISRRHSTRVCLSSLSPSFASGWTYPGKQRSFELTRVTLMNSAFAFWRSPCFFFLADPGGETITMV